MNRYLLDSRELRNGKISKFDFTKTLRKGLKRGLKRGLRAAKRNKGPYTRGQNTVKNFNWGASKGD